MSSIKYITENKYVFLFLVLAGVLFISLFLGVSPNREGMTNGTTTTTNGTIISASKGEIKIKEKDGTKTTIHEEGPDVTSVYFKENGVTKIQRLQDATVKSPDNSIVASVTTPTGITIQRKGDETIIITTTDGVITTINKDDSNSGSGGTGTVVINGTIVTQNGTIITASKDESRTITETDGTITKTVINKMIHRGAIDVTSPDGSKKRTSSNIESAPLNFTTPNGIGIKLTDAGITTIRTNDGETTRISNDGKMIKHSRSVIPVNPIPIIPPAMPGNNNSGAGTSTSGPSINYDNYDHYSKTFYPSVFYGPNSKTAKIVNTDTEKYILVIDGVGNTTTYIISNMTTNSNKINITKLSFSGVNGGSAKIIKAINNQYVIEVTDATGNVVFFTPTNVYNVSSSSALSNANANPSMSTPSSVPSSGGDSWYNDLSNDETEFTNWITGGGPDSYSSPGSSASSTYNYNDVFPKGVSRKMIPKGNEDLYILKSEIVPPVCPACPSTYNATAKHAYSKNGNCGNKRSQYDDEPMPYLPGFTTYGS